MRRILYGIGRGLLGLMKMAGKVVMFLLHLLLGGLKLMLVLFGLVLRLFGAFVRAGTP